MTRYPTLYEILESVCDVFGLPVDLFQSECTGGHITAARRAYSYLARDMTVYSFPEIASFARPDTSGCSWVQHGNRRAERLVQIDSDFEEKVVAARRAACKKTAERMSVVMQ